VWTTGQGKMGEGMGSGGGGWQRPVTHRQHRSNLKRRTAAAHDGECHTTRARFGPIAARIMRAGSGFKLKLKCDELKAEALHLEHTKQHSPHHRPPAQGWAC
jgi:hypothetical protein